MKKALRFLSLFLLATVLAVLMGSGFGHAVMAQDPPQGITVQYGDAGSPAYPPDDSRSCTAALKAVVDTYNSAGASYELDESSVVFNLNPNTGRMETCRGTAYEG